jgi:hypothetical protein
VLKKVGEAFRVVLADPSAAHSDPVCAPPRVRLVAIFMESLGFRPVRVDPPRPRWAVSLFACAQGVVMAGFSRLVRQSWVAAATGLVVVAVAAVLSGGGAGAATTNLRPVCNERDFSLPASVGESVSIPVGQFAADPDLDPIRLVSVFNAGENIGTVVISNTGASSPGAAALKFTLTSSTPGTVDLLWTVSDGSLQAQCGSYASNVPPPPNG